MRITVACRDALIAQRLNDEVADDASVVHVHTRAKGIENASDADIDVLLHIMHTHSCCLTSIAYNHFILQIARWRVKQ